MLIWTASKYVFLGVCVGMDVYVRVCMRTHIYVYNCMYNCVLACSAYVGTEKMFRSEVLPTHLFYSIVLTAFI